MTKEKLLAEIENAPKFHPDYHTGLTLEQVESRLDAGLINKTPKKVTKSYWKIFTDNFFSFFNSVLFGIAILMLIAGIYEIKYYAFLVVLSCNIVIGLITDIHARRLVDKLRLVTDPRVTVVRDGVEKEIPVDQLVYEDVVILTPGEQICADAIVLEGEMKADESLITGESVAVAKTVGSQIYSGSYVKSGKVYACVNRVGNTNYAEDIQSKAKEFRRPKSELKRSCIKIFWVTGSLSIIMGLAELATYLFQCANMVHGFEGGFTPANFRDFAKMMGGSMVAMIPSGLYLLVSLALATGVIALTRKRMNVQELYCIEMLARVDVLCFDKTGTLTDGSIRVHDVHVFDKNYSKEEIGKILSSLVNATHDENSTAKAISSYFGNATYEAVSSIPFDSDYKYSAATFSKKGTYIMGAYGFVDQCPNLDGAKAIDDLSKHGFRVIALYHNQKEIENGKIPSKNNLIAAISFSDHIKSDAKENIEWFRKNGVSIKVISGDNPITVSQIAKEVGVPNASQYISMDQVKDEDIPALVDTYSVFGRVKPEQKALLVEALQKEGHKVAMTGDGVNDIIALKKADCSIAMASGSSAARNVAHIVSMDNNFSKLPDVVGEGRRVINNLQRSASLFLGKTTFAVVLSFVFLILSWFGLPQEKTGYPFSTTNLFIWELCTIGGGGFFLALQPSHERLSGSFMKNVLATAIPSGLVEILCVAILFIAYSIEPNFVSYEAAVACSTIMFTLVSYLILFRISLPMDRYRLFVFILLFVGGGALFLLDWALPAKTFPDGRIESFVLGLNYSVFNWRLALFMTCQFVALAVIYYLLDWVIRKKVTHIDILKRKKEEL